MVKSRMGKRIDMRIVITLLVVALTIVAFINPFEETSSSHLDSAFKRSLAGFAIARGLNGVISVAQGTEFAVQPAGIGVIFAPGEILDPVNDLVERFSWIMLLSSSSLGVQQVLLSMSAWHGILVGLCVAAWALLWIYWVGGSSMPRVRAFMVRLFLLMAVLRFMVPMISIANDWVYHTFLEENYEVASQQLETARDSIDDINEEVLTQSSQQDAGIIDKARNIYRSAVKQIDFEKRLDDYGRVADTVSENIVHLIVVFMMQTVVFPLLFLWVVYVLIRRLFSPTPLGSGR